MQYCRHGDLPGAVYELCKAVTPTREGHETSAMVLKHVDVARSAKLLRGGAVAVAGLELKLGRAARK